MSVNNFLPFCPTDSGTNLLTQSEYAAATDRTIGNQPGVASSKLNNKAIRQSAAVTSQLAQLVSNVLNNDVLDDGSAARLLAQLTATLQYRAPVYTKYTTGSGTWNKTFVFFIASGNATVGATYTNNTKTFTVKSTIASGVVLETTGDGAPSVSGTLTKASGTGDATLTFYAVKSALYMKARMVGAGGGGAGSSVVAATTYGAGGDGTATTFGSSFLTANGGGGGSVNGISPSSGGTATIGAGATGLALRGSPSHAGGLGQAANATPSGGDGADTPYGGGGGGGYPTAPGLNGIANTGAGGGGAGSPDVGAGGYGGAGGSAGGFIDAIISSPAATYAYSIGVGGAAGTAGTNGTAGGAGGDGVIELWECFQ